MTNAADRYRQALVIIRDAAGLLTHEMADKPEAILVDPDSGDLSWSAVHTYITDVLDLNMDPHAALTDLNDDPAGAPQPPRPALRGATEDPLPFPGVPDQPQHD